MPRRHQWWRVRLLAPHSDHVRSADLVQSPWVGRLSGGIHLTLLGYDGPWRPWDVGMHSRQSGWLWLSIPIAFLGAIAAGAGISIESVYEGDTESFATQAVAQDWVTLLVGVPAILLLWWRAANGSFPARLMWNGAAFYFAYTYAIASFMVRFNSLFLVYTSLLACSVFVVAGGIASLDWPLAEQRFGSTWPRRGTMVFLWFVVVAFAFLWLSDIVPALIDGALPESLSESETPTNGVQVLDLSLLLPTAGLTAVWLQRRETRGNVFAMALVTYVCILGLALAAMVIGLTAADLSTDAGVAVAFAIITLAAAELLRRMAASMREHRGAATPVA